MGTAARRTRTTAALALLGTAVCALASSAGAAPQAVDLQIDVVVGSSVRTARPVPNGGTATVSGLRLAAGVEIGLITALPASAKVRLTLPPGLAWGTDLPDPAESCTSTPSTGDCQTPVLEPISGRNAVGWGWDVVAERTGSYVLRAEIVSASEPDPEPSNDSASVTVVVTEASSPPPPPPPGGGGTKVGPVRLSPAKPKAGAAVVASVRMTDGGNPTRPERVACSATAGRTKLKGVGRAGNGSATCTYRTPRSAKGKLLRGAVSFTAVGGRYTKRFSAKLG
jgi:hypothetical protein